jgi:hypothetical protein
MDLEPQGRLYAEKLLKEAQEKWDVYHLHFVKHRPTHRTWKEWLGQNLIEINDHHEIPGIVARLAEENCSYCGPETPVSTDKPPKETDGGIMDMPITL